MRDKSIVVLIVIAMAVFAILSIFVARSWGGPAPMPPSNVNAALLLMRSHEQEGDDSIYLPDPDEWLAQHPDQATNIMPALDESGIPLPVNAPASIPIAIIIIALLKKKYPEVMDKEVVQRLLPMLPLLIATGLSFVPPGVLGTIVVSPVVLKILAGIAAGMAAGWGHKAYKQTVKGNT